MTALLTLAAGAAGAYALTGLLALMPAIDRWCRRRTTTTSRRPS